MEIISAKTKNREYDIYLGNNISKKAIEMINKRFAFSEKTVLVTDENINSIYAQDIEEFLEAIGKKFIKIVIGEGEKFKSLESLKFIYENLLSSNIHRNDLVIAFGGGVIGDLTGFAASTFHRGINLIQYPTTLVGQVDSSIGGKVVVNYKGFKNIIGAFYQPHMVVIDQSFLDTLDIKDIKNGLSEIIKYGLCFNKEIIEYFENMDPSNGNTVEIKNIVNSRDFLKIIKKCVEIKARVVQKDEFDKGERNFLNFGHTFGHALEKVGDLDSISHGHAVSIGIMVALRLSINEGYLEESIFKRVLGIYKRLGLAYILPDGDISNIINMIGYDKKSTGKNKRYILLEGIERPAIKEDIDDDKLFNILKEYKKYKNN